MLEDSTGIAAATWRTYYTRGIRPTADLIEAAAKAWPKHAFWLVTGVQDDQFGHTAPVGHGFPQKIYLDGNEPSKVYFEKLIEAFGWLDEHNEVFENTISPLVNEGKIPSISDTEANNELTKARLLSSIETAQSIRKIELFLAIYVKDLTKNELEAKLPNLMHELNLTEIEATRAGMKIAVDPIRQKINELIQWQKKYDDWNAFKNKVGLN